jgi:hypothetical protein
MEVVGWYLLGIETAAQMLHLVEQSIMLVEDLWDSHMDIHLVDFVTYSDVQGILSVVQDSLLGILGIHSAVHSIMSLPTPVQVFLGCDDFGPSGVHASADKVAIKIIPSYIQGPRHITALLMPYNRGPQPYNHAPHAV